MDLVEAVYRLTAAWPSSEMYGLTSQVRRATVSVPSNIAEGQGRSNEGDFIRSLAIAHGSLREVETQLLISQRIGYSTMLQVQPLLDAASEAGRLIQGLANSLKAKRER